jgi:hypothetical protein
VAAAFLRGAFQNGKIAYAYRAAILPFWMKIWFLKTSEDAPSSRSLKWCLYRRKRSFAATSSAACYAGRERAPRGGLKYASDQVGCKMAKFHFPE